MHLSVANLNIMELRIHYIPSYADSAAIIKPKYIMQLPYCDCPLHWKMNIIIFSPVIYHHMFQNVAVNSTSVISILA